MNNNEVKKELSKFGAFVVQQSRSRLTKAKKNASGDLYNSLSYDIETFPNSFSFSFYWVEKDGVAYGEFVDKGVSGTKKKYNTPFSYKSKRPPAKVFEDWSRTRGIRGRDKKTGKFISRKSLSFILQRHIFENGMKPTLFFTKPFEQAFEKLPDELVEAYGLDIENFLNFTLK